MVARKVTEGKKQVPNAPKGGGFGMTNLCLARSKGKSRSLALLGMTTFDGAIEWEGAAREGSLGFCGRV